MSQTALWLVPSILSNFELHFILQYQPLTLCASSTTAAGRSSFYRRSVLQISHNEGGSEMDVVLPYEHYFLTFVIKATTVPDFAKT